MSTANFGNSNDENSSRRFFEEYEVSAEITRVDKHLIYRLKVILDYICCDLNMNVQDLEKYCQETAELYEALCSF